MTSPEYNPLPSYLNCNNQKIVVCEYLLTPYCKSTCAYARDVGGIGMEAADPSIFNGLEKKLNENNKNERGIKKNE